MPILIKINAMVKPVYNDEKGVVTPIPVAVHNYDSLPGKGFVKDFDVVGIDEPVLIPTTAQVVVNPIYAGYLKAELERRAYALGAETAAMLLPANSMTTDHHMIKIWFFINNTRP